MLDELLDDRRGDLHGESHQKEIIARYCSEFEHRVRSASSRQQAMALVNASCREFKHSCPSAIVRKFLESYAEGLLDRHWSSRL